jgi:hypothetical protein
MEVLQPADCKTRVQIVVSVYSGVQQPAERELLKTGKTTAGTVPVSNRADGPGHPTCLKVSC